MIDHVVPNKFSEIILKSPHRKGCQLCRLFFCFTFFIRIREMGQEAESECDQMEMAFDPLQVSGLVIAQAQQLLRFFEENLNPPAFSVTLEDGFLREPKVIGDNRKKALFFSPPGEDHNGLAPGLWNHSLDPFGSVSDALSLAVLQNNLGRLLPEKLFSKLPGLLLPSANPKIAVGFKSRNKEETSGNAGPDNILSQIIGIKERRDFQTPMGLKAFNHLCRRFRQFLKDDFLITAVILAQVNPQRPRDQFVPEKDKSKQNRMAPPVFPCNMILEGFGPFHLLASFGNARIVEDKEDVFSFAWPHGLQLGQGAFFQSRFRIPKRRDDKVIDLGSMGSIRPQRFPKPLDVSLSPHNGYGQHYGLDMPPFGFGKKATQRLKKSLDLFGDSDDFNHGPTSNMSLLASATDAEAYNQRIGALGLFV